MIIKRNKIKRKKIKRVKSRINIIINYYLKIILFLINSNKHKDNIKYLYKKALFKLKII